MSLGSSNSATWLLVDTTGVGCHIGLHYRGNCWTESDMQPQAHTKRILPMIESLLCKANCSMQELEGIIYTQGPGSFTGVRVGVSVVQGLSFGLSIPTLGVSTLMTIAWQAYLQTQQNYVGALIDARMSQIYWGVYDFSQAVVQCEPDSITSLEQVLTQSIPDLIAGDVHLCQNQTFIDPDPLSLCAQPVVDIKALFSLVELGLTNEFLCWDAQLALPIYLRNDVAHVSKKQAVV